MDQDKILMKHNDLVNAKYEPRITHNRIFTYLLYAFQKHAFVSKDSTSLEYVVSREELARIVGKTSDQTIKGLTNILQTLRKKDLYLIEELEDGSTDYIAGGFINNAVYNDLSDTFKITADTRIHRLLQRYLDDGYTPVNLEIWLTLKNRYSQRFYDLIRMWSGTKDVINYKIEYLRKIFMLENRYKQHTDFRKRVLDPAIEDLNSTGFFEITYTENRVGRSVDSIDFKVKDLDKRKYFDKIVTKQLIEYGKNGNNKGLEREKEEKSINTQQEDKKTLKIENNGFYIPDRDVLAKGTLRIFEKDFRHIDFRNRYMALAFEDSVTITLDKDDVDTIKAASYKFFKGTLENKIEYYKEEEKKDLKDKIETNIYWPEYK